jgi:acyl-CoA reductase-like NAD-dependent aldehyde dehydrogenase
VRRRPRRWSGPAEGGKVVVGGARRDLSAGVYVEPAIVRMPAQTPVVREETFAPILNVLTCDTFDEAIALHNDVLHGLSSSIFTRDQQEAERFLAADSSVCGIANVNIGISGAEIGGAFGGEKQTGGGRESGWTPGGPPCAAPPTRSTTPAIWRWLRTSASSDIHILHTAEDSDD